MTIKKEDLADVLYYHARDFTSLKPVTWRCSCGLSYASRGDGSFYEHQAAVVLAYFEQLWPQHSIELAAEGWTIQHSMACRLSGQLLDCPYTHGASKLEEDGTRGRFYYSLENGVLVRGDRVSRDGWL